MIVNFGMILLNPKETILVNYVTLILYHNFVRENINVSDVYGNINKVVTSLGEFHQGVWR